MRKNITKKTKNSGNFEDKYLRKYVPDSFYDLNANTNWYLFEGIFNIYRFFALFEMFMDKVWENAIHYNLAEIDADWENFDLCEKSIAMDKLHHKCCDLIDKLFASRGYNSMQKISKAVSITTIETKDLLEFRKFFKLEPSTIISQSLAPWFGKYFSALKVLQGPFQGERPDAHFKIVSPLVEETQEREILANIENPIMPWEIETAYQKKIKADKNNQRSLQKRNQWKRQIETKIGHLEKAIDFAVFCDEVNPHLKDLGITRGGNALKKFFDEWKSQ